MGPLHGVRILELGSIGPGPFAAMLLADMGAEVLRLDRKGGGMMVPPHLDPTQRGRAARLEVDLKDPADRDLVLELCASADALLEGFRPGVMERLGLGPAETQARNPKLVFGRMTGYGQEGPMASVAGHDINYISVAGALGAIARQGERPLFPLNLVGDYGGGGMFLAFGVVCAILEARGSGQGQVVDAAMVDGAAVLCSLMYGLRAAGAWSDVPGTNLLDSGAHFYEVYETADGGFVSVGAIEPQFYARLLELLEIPADDMPQFAHDRWPEFKERLAAIFKGRDRDAWAQLLEHEEACATVVRGFADAHEHPHMQARGAFVELDGVLQPAAAPRFDRTPSEARRGERDAAEVLAAWGVGERAQARAAS
ncbi:MAG TPA: CaiB/BaiF CoA-transferase family protein [Baekduia sp.]|nr:CaiB/BaiF CoA-transferase family protein [Baekduia sp.]